MQVLITGNPWLDMVFSTHGLAIIGILVALWLMRSKVVIVWTPIVRARSHPAPAAAKRSGTKGPADHWQRPGGGRPARHVP